MKRSVLILFLGLWSQFVFGASRDGLVLHFTFDNEPGKSGMVLDESGYGNHGYVQGAPALVSGAAGNAFEFDGANDYIFVPRSASLNTATQITMAAWFKAYRYEVQRPIIDYYDITNGFGAHMWCNVHGGAWYGTGANLNEAGGIYGKAHIICVPDPGLYEWHHMVVTYSASTGIGRLYLNGELSRTLNMGAFTFGSAYDVYIACRPQPGWLHRWDGCLDDIRIYNRPLSTEEVVALYKGSEGDCPPCISFVGFSSDPAGDQDVTLFYQNETLYIRVCDVDLDENSTVHLIITPQKRKGAAINERLVYQPNGSFKGAFPLSKLKIGKAQIRILGNSRSGMKLLKDTDITILPAQ